VNGKQFSEKEKQMSNKYIKQYSTPLAMKKCQSAEHQWLMPIILATQEKIVCKTVSRKIPSQKKSLVE
jgi:hypothetical protein